MTAIKKKPNHFDRSKTDANNTAQEIFEENDTGYIKYEQIDKCPLVDLATILSSKKIKTWCHFTYF